MATGMAHEINNPVAAIRLHTQLLENEISGAALERLDIILSEAAKIEGLVSQWMFLARPQPPQTAPCDLADLVANAVRTLDPAAVYASVQVVNEVPAGSTVTADRRRIAQAIINIVTNAIHAMAATGGTLRITTKQCGGGTIHLLFADTGPGFSTAALARGTELFFSEKEGGMGIGLSVTSEILRAHHGRLDISNHPQGGALVTLELPAGVTCAKSTLHAAVAS
jgi:signal transduction histidine kinase